LIFLLLPISNPHDKMKIKDVATFFSKLSFKTIYFNFKYLPFKSALKFPILISSKVRLVKCEGEIHIEGPLRTGMIQIGYQKVGIFDHKKSRSIWDLSGKMYFKGKASIGQGTKFTVGKSAKIIFGQNFNLSAETAMICVNHIEFGDNCLLSWDILIMDSDLHDIVDDQGSTINPPTPVYIGSDVWIGCRTTILKGSSIPSNAIIAANSVVSKKLHDQHCIYGGNPLKVIKTNIGGFKM